MVYVASLQHHLFYFPDWQFVCVPFANIVIAIVSQKVGIQSLVQSLPPWLTSTLDALSSIFISKYVEYIISPCGNPAG